MSSQSLSNRNKMPSVAKAVDRFREVFGPGVCVLHAKEGDYELGVPLDKAGLVTPSIDANKTYGKQKSQFDASKKLNPNEQKRLKKSEQLSAMLAAGQIKLAQSK